MSDKENADDKKRFLAWQGSWSNKLTREQYAHLIEDSQLSRDKYHITVVVDAKICICSLLFKQTKFNLIAVYKLFYTRLYE